MDTWSARAECRPQRHLPGAPLAGEHQQIRDVRARHEEHQRHRRHQHERLPAGITDEIIPQWGDPAYARGLAGLLDDGGADGLELGSCRLQAGSGPQAPDDLGPDARGAVVPGELVEEEAERQKHLGVVEGHEGRGGDAHDRESLTTELDRPSHDAPVRSERAGPETVPHDRDTGGAWLRLLFPEIAAHCRLGHEGLEEPTRDPGHIDDSGARAGHEAPRPGKDDREPVETSGALLPIAVVRKRDRRGEPARLELVDQDEPVGVFEWKGLEQQPVHHGEDRRIGPDPEGERRGDQEREARTPGHTAQREREVEPHRIEERSDPVAGVGKSDAQDLPEEPQRPDESSSRCVLGVALAQISDQPRPGDGVLYVPLDQRDDEAWKRSVLHRPRASSRPVHSASMASRDSAAAARPASVTST